MDKQEEIPIIRQWLQKLFARVALMWQAFMDLRRIHKNLTRILKNTYVFQKNIEYWYSEDRFTRKYLYNRLYCETYTHWLRHGPLLFRIGSRSSFIKSTILGGSNFVDKMYIINPPSAIIKGEAPGPYWESKPSLSNKSKVPYLRKDWEFSPDEGKLTLVTAQDEGPWWRQLLTETNYMIDRINQYHAHKQHDREQALLEATKSIEEVK